MTHANGIDIPLHETSEVVPATHGGEDPIIRARERFRRRTQSAIDKFREKVLKNPGVNYSSTVDTLCAECGSATLELRETLAALHGVPGRDAPGYACD